MLKRIQIEDLRVGMYIHEFAGNWLDHPFWRSSFLIQSERELARLLQSGIKEIWINVARGADVEGGLTVEESNAAIERELEREAVEPLSPGRVPMEEEVVRARKIMSSASRVVAELFNDARMGKAIHIENVVPVVGEITSAVQRNPGVLTALSRLRSQDNYTYVHSVSVCALMVALGDQLGLGSEQKREVGLAGLMHDIGKVRVDAELLNKKGQLTEGEFAELKRHPEYGHDLLIGNGGASEAVLDVCLHHHERADGSGYPHRQADREISLYSQIAAVCDVYDATTSERSYKAAWQPAYALRKMAEWSTGHFDTRVFHAFVKTVGIYPIGTLVRLKSNFLAVVLDQSGSSLLTPRVKAFFSIPDNRRISPRVVDLSVETADGIVGFEDPAAWNIADLYALWSGQDRRV